MRRPRADPELDEYETDGLTIDRVGGFTDGVLAIAITLLVLQLGTSSAAGSLAERLRGEWPYFLSYVISFVNIGAIWLNHHKVTGRINRIDHTFLILNLVVLLVVTFLPFPTRVISQELATGGHADQRTAALLYTGTFLVASISFYALWRWAEWGGRLIKEGLPEQLNRVPTVRFGLVVPLFAIPCVLAFFSPLAAVIGDGVLMVTFLLSDAT